jgi:lipoprotein signal peptidase
MPSSSPAVRHVVRRARHQLTTPVAHRPRFAAMTGLVVYGDLVTKQAAVSCWGAERYPLGGRLVHIHVVYNRLGAFGTSLGAHTREINVVATLAAVMLAMLFCRRLANVDEAAPATLGLIAGAGLGNLASMVSSTAGVPDFLFLGVAGGRSVAMNVADVAAMLGLACSVRLAWVLVRGIRQMGRS